MRLRLGPLRRAAAALVLAAVVLAPAAAGDPSQSLRRRDDDLAAKARAASLDLYAIESRLARARGQLQTIRVQAETLRQERAMVADRLVVARRGVRISQTRLAARLRGIYERGDIDPLAIVLGADSLDAAISGLDSLGQMARGDRTVAQQLSGARRSLAGLRQRLARRQRVLDRLVADATATARALETTRAAKATYVRQLATERQMTEAAIAQAEQRARAAREQARLLEAAATPPAPAPATAPVDTPAAPAAAGSITVTATGYSIPGTTATGLPVGWGVAAVDPSVIPLGTRFTVPGYGEAVAADVGGAVQGATIDLWFPSAAQAEAWGRRTVTVVLG